MREFHDLLPSGNPRLNRKVRYIADLLESNLDIFRVVEGCNHDYPADFLMIECDGNDTCHPYFENFDLIHVLVDPKISNPLKSIVRLFYVENSA